MNEKVLILKDKIFNLINCSHCDEEFLKTLYDALMSAIENDDIGEMSDGYHTFNSLYYQRMILSATLAKAYPFTAWKSHYHEDGSLPFGGGWFIVGFSTPEGEYTYHYQDEYWDLFDCVELPVGKHWDGHTEDDVNRLLSLR